MKPLQNLLILLLPEKLKSLLLYCNFTEFESITHQLMLAQHLQGKSALKIGSF